ncbi:MAG: FAD-dependent thymidylate synthase [Planctomycetota bacterium]|nr:MAG: FAD-dependent thymidylate synthase [Planctomycetota bacterium]
MEDALAAPSRRLSIELTGCGIEPAPVVELQNWFERPYDNSVATARTCYSSKVVYPEDVARDEQARALRDRIAASTYKAGHHTTIQHPTFQFVLKRVSRQFLWSFLHQHPFYNSEQVSQRYVKVRRGRYTTPPLPSEAARTLFQGACERLQQAYRSLLSELKGPVREEYFAIYPARRKRAERWEKAIDKRVYEAARYVLPVATHAHLYHTVSGLTLHRYRRLVEFYDCPAEQRAVVGAMVELVERVSPGFFRHAEDPLPLEKTLEFELFTRLCSGAEAAHDRAAFAREFDERLGGLRSRLVDWKVNGQASLAQAVRSVLGLSRQRLSDAEAIRCVLDPARNGPFSGGSLNLSAHLKLTRALHHPHYTFAKKLSHTADSQDQRHRMTPGSRPIIAAQALLDAPDLVLPPIVERTPSARELVERVARQTLADIARLLELGADPSAAHYLLLNATAVRFEESGDLLNFHHKWSLRLCYLAQEEIWRASCEEVRQVREIEPEVGALLGPPCWSRHRAGHTPYCPEGDRFCGVPVWSLDLDDYRRVI